MRRTPKDQTRRYKSLLGYHRDDPERYLSLKECQSVEFLTLYLKESTTLNHSDDGLAERRNSVGVTLADKVENPHLQVKARVIQARWYGIKEDLSKTIEILVEAERLSPECPCCLAQVFYNMGNYFFNSPNVEGTAFQDVDTNELALALFNKGLEYSKGDDSQTAKILMARGPVSYFLNEDLDQSLDDMSRAQRLLGKDEPSLYTLIIVVNTAWLLTHGDEEHFRRAKSIIKDARRWIKGTSDLKELRCIVLWLEGLIVARSGDRRTASILLHRAAKGFKELKLETHYLSVQADLAKLYLQKRSFFAIRRLFENKVSWLKRESQDLVEKIREALDREDSLALGQLITELRLAQSVQIAQLI